MDGQPCSCSHTGSGSDRGSLKPLQLPVPYRCGTRRPFEEQAAAFVAATVARWPALKVVAWTRVPYLSSGDARRTWYTLDNAVFVMRVGEMTEVASF